VKRESMNSGLYTAIAAMAKRMERSVFIEDDETICIWS
jgi:hypothetical protein